MLLHGDPDQWVGLLDRVRPDIDVAQLRMFAVEGKWLGRVQAWIQVMYLVILVAQRGGHLAAGEVSIHRRPYRKTRCTNRPPLTTSSMANSSATRMGGYRALKLLPGRSALREVLRVSAAAIRLGDLTSGRRHYYGARYSRAIDPRSAYSISSKKLVEQMPLFGVEEMARYINPHHPIFLGKSSGRKWYGIRWNQVKFMDKISCQAQAGSVVTRRTASAVQRHICWGKAGRGVPLHIGLGSIRSMGAIRSDAFSTSAPP